MGPGAADIAEIIPELRNKLPDLEPPPSLEPEQARFRLFDSITTFLKNSAQAQPLVLVLDDLHWADRSSLLLLEFLARNIGGSRLLVLGAYRDVELSRQHPLADTLGELTRGQLLQRLPLRRWGPEEVSRFVERAAAQALPLGLTQAVYSQTEGNPLFVAEMVRLLNQEGELTSEESQPRESFALRLPEGVREVIGRRLNRLSSDCNALLSTASVIGREFSMELLKRLNENISDDRLLEILEEALFARIIEELPHSLNRYQFAHALIQETLADELTMTRKVRLHGRIAQALEELYGANADFHAAELAYHFFQAEASLGPDKLIHYCLQAGEQAVNTYAWEEAVDRRECGK